MQMEKLNHVSQAIGKHIIPLTFPSDLRSAHVGEATSRNHALGMRRWRFDSPGVVASVFLDDDGAEGSRFLPFLDFLAVEGSNEEDGRSSSTRLSECG